ncbi:sulfotransferase family protein [Aestuariivirga sp.]|uniref:sulfotransferase family protein n=1 Tax=Aestuariivirga sp. TaxID=2650926 RepID=UPI00391D3A46
MPLQVIGAGVGRTGTYSLKLALERLGLGPTHHMEEVIKDPPRHVPGWHAAALGKVDWDVLYEGYGSAVDWPTASFWKELSEEYPEAKVVLSTRSPESWHDSFSETIHKLMGGADQAPPHMKPFLEMAAAVLGKAGFSGKTSREELIAAFNAHNDAVKEGVPSGRLLVYEVRDGWEPLCDFLGCDVPDEPFPRSNNREDFWDRIKNGGR